MKARTIITLVLAGLLTVLFASISQSQDDIMELKADAFAKHTRPAAVFIHDAHNEKAEIDECNVCHHVYEDGKFMADDDSAGTACSECHGLKANGSQPGLMNAYHKMCKGCHQSKAKGPMACGECHVKK